MAVHQEDEGVGGSRQVPPHHPTKQAQTRGGQVESTSSDVVTHQETKGSHEHRVSHQGEGQKEDTLEKYNKHKQNDQEQIRGY